MNRVSLKTISLFGTPHEIAFKLGKQRKKAIEKRVQFWNQRVSKLFQGKKEKLKTLEKSFFQESEKQAPDLLEEIYAMSEGAGVPFKDLFRLNLTELRSFVEKCTTIIIPYKTAKGRKILLAHNEDWAPKRNDVFVLNGVQPDCSYTVLSYDGYLPGLCAGVNSFGLCQAANYLEPKSVRVGLPRIFVTRRLVTAKSIPDFLSHLKKTKRAFGQAIHMAQGSKYMGLELTATQTKVWKPKFPAAHSNNYLAYKGITNAPSFKASNVRTQMAQSLLDDNMRRRGRVLLPLKAAKNLAKKVLSDRSSHPYAIWRDADCIEDGAATIATVLVSTDSTKAEVYRNRPDRSEKVKV